MRIQLTQVPDKYQKCFGMEGHIIFEEFMREVMEPVEQEYVHRAFDQRAKHLMLDRIVSEINQVLPFGFTCDHDDFILEMQTGINNIHPNGIVDFQIHQPLLGILSALTFIKTRTVTCSSNL